MVTLIDKLSFPLLIPTILSILKYSLAQSPGSDAEPGI